MSLRPAFRIARREALRAPGRSALVVAMVALPVLGVTGVDVLARSAQLDPPERVVRELGRAQAELTYLGKGIRVLQAPDPKRGATTLTGGVQRPPSLGGYRLLTSRERGVTFRTAAGVGPLAVREIASGDPAFAGKLLLREGRFPRARGEVAATRRALGRLGAPVGGTATILEPRRRVVRVVGVVEDAAAREGETVWAPPGSVLGRFDPASGEPPPVVYLAGGRPVTWQDVMRLNRAGLVVRSRAVLLDPPARSDVPYFTGGHAVDPGGRGLIVLIGVVLAVTLGVLEVVLLAGAAFAVGARRQERSLGLVTATGGAPQDVRRIVLAAGVVLGSVGAGAGVLLGLAGAAAAMPLLERHAGQDFGHFDVQPVELAAAALMGLATGVLAAVLPARAAARRDPVEALTGRRARVRTRRRVPAAGIALALLGVGIAGLGSAVALSHAAGVYPGAGGPARTAALLIAAGGALAQVGLIVCTPALVGLAGRLARRLPLVLRLALTDASRHRGRTAPAVAAVLTAVTAGTALALVIASLDDSNRSTYRPTWPARTAGIELESVRVTPDGTLRRSSISARRVLAAVQSALPPATPLVVRSPVGCDDTADPACRTVAPVLPRASECPAWAAGTSPAAARDARAHDWRCDDAILYQGGHLPQAVLGDARLLRALAGRRDERAERLLAAGGVVALDRRYVAGGTIAMDVTTEQGTRVRLPAVLLRTARPPVVAVYGPGAARRLGVRPVPTHLLLSFRQLPTTAQEDAARAALRAAGIEGALTVERGYRSRHGLVVLALVLGAALITLGAAGIATGLAQADARADHATLAAVGATPGMRRRLGAAQALAIAGLGSVLGVLAGLVPSLAFVGAIDSMQVVVPWATLAEILVGIPLAAAAGAWLLTRSRLPLERRVAL